MIKRPAQTELTWVKAVLVGMAITIFLLITLAWIPSWYTYWWASRDASAIKIIQNVVHHLPGGAHHTIQPYTSTRVRDAISMGYQTTVFAALIRIIPNSPFSIFAGQPGATESPAAAPGSENVDSPHAPGARAAKSTTALAAR